MVHRPRPVSESYLLRASLQFVVLAGAVVTPAALMFASAAPMVVRLYIAAISTLLLLMTLALVAGVTRETMRGLRRTQVVLRARRRVLGDREPMGARPLAA